MTSTSQESQRKPPKFVSSFVPDDEEEGSKKPTSGFVSSFEPDEEDQPQAEEKKATEDSYRTGFQFVSGAPLALLPVAIHQALNPSAQSAIEESKEDVGAALGRGDISLEQYKKAISEIENSGVEEGAPTLSNLYSAIEKKTGLPLTPKTDIQKKINLGSNVAFGSRAAGAEKLESVAGGVIGAGSSMELEKAGVPTEIADPVGAAIGAWISMGKNVSEATQKREPKQLEFKTFKSPPPGGFPEDAPPPPPGAPPPPPVNPNALVPRTAPGTPPPQQSKAAALFTPYDVAKKVKEMIPEPPPYSKEPRLQEPPEEVKYLLPEEVPMLPKETIEKASGAKSVENLYDPTFAHNEIGNAISQQKPLPKVTGGKYLVHTLEDIEVPVRERISGVKLPDGRREGGVYAQAREMMAGNTYADPSFSRYLLSEKDRLENMPAGTRSSPQNKLLKSINGILSKTNALSSDELTGNITYGPVIPVDSQLMIDIQQNLQDVVNYDFAGKEPTAIFKPLINRIEKHLEDATKDTNAYPALKHANSVYKRSWAEPFLNEKLLPFRNESKDTNLVGLYEKATNDYDTFRALQKALKIGKEEGGDVIEKLLKRDLVQNKLSPYIKEPKLIGSPEFQKEILELKTILSKDEFRKVIENLNMSKKVQNQISKTKREAKKAQAEIVAHKEAVRVRAATAKNIERAQKKANMSLQEKAAEINKEKKRLHKEYSEQYEKEHGVKTKILSMTPEQISKHASTISGLEEIEKLLSEIEGGDKAYDLLTSIQSKELLSKGKVEGTAQDVLEVISNTENRRYLVKTLGAPNVREIQVIAKNQIKLTELLKGKYELLDKIEVPKKWTHKLNSWAKIRREALMAAAHPSHFLENLAKGWANDGVTKEQILANNKEHREKLEYINSQLEELEKLKK